MNTESKLHIPAFFDACQDDFELMEELGFNRAPQTEVASWRVPLAIIKDLQASRATLLEETQDELEREFLLYGTRMLNFLVYKILNECT